MSSGDFNFEMILARPIAETRDFLLFFILTNLIGHVHALLELISL